MNKDFDERNELKKNNKFSIKRVVILLVFIFVFVFVLLYVFGMRFHGHFNVSYDDVKQNDLIKINSNLIK